MAGFSASVCTSNGASATVVRWQHCRKCIIHEFICSNGQPCKWWCLGRWWCLWWLVRLTAAAQSNHGRNIIGQQVDVTYVLCNHQIPYLEAHAFAIKTLTFPPNNAVRLGSSRQSGCWMLLSCVHSLSVQRLGQSQTSVQSVLTGHLCPHLIRTTNDPLNYNLSPMFFSFFFYVPMLPPLPPL